MIGIRIPSKTNRMISTTAAIRIAISLPYHVEKSSLNDFCFTFPLSNSAHGQSPHRNMACLLLSLYQEGFLRSAWDHPAPSTLPTHCCLLQSSLQYNCCSTEYVRQSAAPTSVRKADCVKYLKFLLSILFLHTTIDIIKIFYHIYTFRQSY